MKKVFFTALALVAFSSASMANTIADEEIVKENKKEVKNVIKSDYWDCAAVACDVYDELTAVGVYEPEALIEADDAFNDCMSESDCIPPFRC